MTPKKRPGPAILIDGMLLARKLRRDLRAAGLEPPEDEWSERPSG